MNIRIAIVLCCFLLNLKAQEKILISENDGIRIYETYLTLNSTGNIFPTLYNEGLIYASNHNSSNYKLFYSNLKSESQKFKIGKKYLHKTEVFAVSPSAALAMLCQYWSSALTSSSRLALATSSDSVFTALRMKVLLSKLAYSLGTRRT